MDNIEDLKLKKIEEAYDLIHGNLRVIPKKFCYWKEDTGEMHTCKYWEDFFNFIKNDVLRRNLGQIRLCLDYQATLYKLHCPTLVFEQQHRYILAQIFCSIYEGVLLDLARHKRAIKEDDDYLSFGKLIGGCRYRGFITKDISDYLFNILSLRNTIHPEVFFCKNVRTDINPLMTCKIDDFFKELNDFILFIKEKY